MMSAAAASASSLHAKRDKVSDASNPTETIIKKTRWAQPHFKIEGEGGLPCCSMKFSRAASPMIALPKQTSMI
jgi:hypothetical protein